MRDDRDLCGEISVEIFGIVLCVFIDFILVYAGSVVEKTKKRGQIKIIFR